MPIDASNPAVSIGPPVSLSPPVSVADPARSQIAGAIKQASGNTGASFQYLLATAQMESNFNPTAQASTSSAKGLFQFIEQTWLGTVKEAGASFGYGQYADAIAKSATGSYSVSDPATRQAIMNLRNDPAIASAMAGALTQSNSFKLTGEIGRRPTDAELYMAHFMGVGGASQLINAAQDTPNANAASLFPSAAAANQSIFYDRNGSARTVAQVYDNLNSRYAAAASSQATQSAMASFGGTAMTAAAPATASAAPIVNPAYLSGFPDVRGVAPASASSAVASSTSSTTQVQAQVQASSQQPTSSEPMFRTLFIGGDRSDPISPAVRALWGGASGASSTAPTTSTGRAQPQLDLFSDRNGTFGG